MGGRYNINDTAFLIESNRIIREVKILKYAGGLYTVRFVDGAGGIKVRENRLFATEDEANATLPKPAPRFITPWD